jgi:hypothetical protein
MSELSMDELQAETGELLPERETLGTITISQVGSASAVQSNSFFAAGNSNTAVLVQSVHATNGSFNSHHNTFFVI